MMKRITAYLMAGLLAITACKKDNEKNAPQGTGKGVVTPVGTPEEAIKAAKVIGAGGGTLSSLDGKISVSIPAGALAGDQNVTIQRITNNNPMGIHSGYRITPHNVQFTKEVTITFPYTDEDLTGTVPEALGIAFQDTSGVWREIINSTLDKTNKKVSVKTTHFSDWTFFESFAIKTSATLLPVKGVANMEVFSDADMLAPEEDDSRPIGERSKITADYVKNWTLIGAGQLKSSGPEATYTAPATVPTTQNPVTITVNINLGRKGTFIVLTNIKITNEGEISVRVGDGTWFTQEASPSVKFADGYYSIAEADGDASGHFVFARWPGGVGTFPFKEPTAPTGTHAHYHITGVDNYTASYIKDQELKASGGGITITSIGEPNGFFEGTFIINPAGHGPTLNKTAKVEGKFRIKRTW